MYGDYGFRRVLLAASVTLTLTTIGCAFLTAATPVVVIALLALVSGAARSVSMTGYTTLALSDVPPMQMRNANALASTAQQLFTGLAVVLATLALRLGDAVGRLSATAQGARFAFVIAFFAISVVGAMATAVPLRLHPSAGDPLRGGVTVRGTGTTTSAAGPLDSLDLPGRDGIGADMADDTRDSAQAGSGVHRAVPREARVEGQAR